MCARIMEQGLIDLNWLHLIWTELTYIYIYTLIWNESIDLIDWFDLFVWLIDWLIVWLIDWLFDWLIDWLIPDHWDLNPHPSKIVEDEGNRFPFL